jgi:acyl carrier protein
MAAVTAQEAQSWLLERIAGRLGVQPHEVSPERSFHDFDLDSTESVILAAELEEWLGFPLGTTALWYHPTTRELAEHIAEESRRHATAAT